MLTLFGVILALGILVTIHEGGHFLAARFFGVYVEKFSIGFGPKLAAFKKGDTEYRLSLLPLGGYVKMKGENLSEETADPDAFCNKAWWQRAIIAFSGPFANLLLAFVVFAISFMIGREFVDNYPIVGRVLTQQELQLHTGDEILSVNDNPVRGWAEIGLHLHADQPNSFVILREGATIALTDSLFTGDILSEQQVQPWAPAIIGDVTPGLPAYKGGLKAGDEILSVNDEPVSDWYEMRNKILQTSGPAVTLNIRRNDTQFSKILTLEDNVLDDQRIIGITQQMPVKTREAYPVFTSLKISLVATITVVGVNYMALYKLIQKPSSIKSNIGGPVMMYEMSRQSAKGGLNSILWYLGAISIMLMVINLLPIPVLDGGHIFVLLIEGLRGKPLPQKMQFALQNVGLLIILTLMIYGFINDFSRIAQRTVNVRQQSKLIQE
jgi:regulator of sigma E protease